MERGSIVFLKGTVIALGLIVLALCVFALPAGIFSSHYSLYRPIFLAMYLPAIPFFVALYEALKLLGYIEQNKAFSELSVTTLQRIKNCALIISGFYTLGLPYIYFAANKDDAPGVIIIGLVIIFAALVIGVFSALLQKLLHSALEIKSENDLTV